MPAVFIRHSGRPVGRADRVAVNGRRAGLHTWPILRRREAELAAQIRQVLGDDHHFGRAFAAGARLSQQQVVAAIGDQPSDHTQPS
ncbi:MAG TPA: hypothetical protein VEF71_09900 [Streptosporangiaceae bacterium]|nr:hypothetical protein [Streptosporangiaceae bacterium]